MSTLKSSITRREVPVSLAARDGGIRDRTTSVLGSRGEGLMVKWQHLLSRDSRCFINKCNRFRVRNSVVVTTKSIRPVCNARGDTQVYVERLYGLASLVERWDTMPPRAQGSHTSSSISPSSISSNLSSTDFSSSCSREYCLHHHSSHFFLYY